jgi:excisionase family DNA binding protein
MRIKDIMANLRICRSTVYKHIKGGDLVAYRIGRLVRVTPGDLEDFVKRERSICRSRSRHQN